MPLTNCVLYGCSKQTTNNRKTTETSVWIEAPIERESTIHNNSNKRNKLFNSWSFNSLFLFSRVRSWSLINCWELKDNEIKFPYSKSKIVSQSTAIEWWRRTKRTKILSSPLGMTNFSNLLAINFPFEKWWKAK